MSHLAIVSDIVGYQQFGALPKRSATDLVSCVVHDIDESRTQGWVSTLVTLDVQGAFDAVLHNKLIWRMQAQGWPDSVLQWTASFLKSRTVQVRYAGGVTSPKGINFGVPQVSELKMGNSIASMEYMDTEPTLIELIPSDFWSIPYLSLPGILVAATHINPVRVGEVCAANQSTQSMSVPAISSTSIPVFRATAPAITPYDGQPSTLCHGSSSLTFQGIPTISSLGRVN
ncbi:hypothetical protein EPUL_003087 [Erysiphe pulchra]|uniref:Uncharacterized protein n=1 Tax=Erysiphe pulchra TaxID=225359 RepID=A0A2S4PTD0_9PEZI|nr:hypothetical protein EPUL_003087 [Erysiphe pulchra]